MENYNKLREETHTILAAGGKRNTGGRLWYKGKTFDNETFEVYAEDCQFAIHDLSHSSLHTDFDAKFTYTFANIDRMSQPMGTPWEPDKDTAFAYDGIYIGLLWNLPQ